MPWCQKCDIALELACSEDMDKLPVAARGIAMVAASIPGFGTTVSFIINTAVSLAEGEPIGQALLDGIGGTLPIHPASGMAFNAPAPLAGAKASTESQPTRFPSTDGQRHSEFRGYRCRRKCR